VTLVAIDEVQDYFGHPVYGKEIEDLITATRPIVP
jgi:hypothetical protein